MVRISGLIKLPRILAAEQDDVRHDAMGEQDADGEQADKDLNQLGFHRGSSGENDYHTHKLPYAQKNAKCPGDQRHDTAPLPPLQNTDAAHEVKYAQDKDAHGQHNEDARRHALEAHELTAAKVAAW